MSRWIAFTVTVTLTNPAGELPFVSEETMAQLLDSLGVRRPTLSFSDSAICLTCEVLAVDAEMAIAVVTAYLDDALNRCDLPSLHQSAVALID